MADRKRRTAPSREFIREREESSRNRRPSRNRYQEDYDSDEEYDDYDDDYEDDSDEDYDDYDEDYEDEDFEEEPQSLKRRKSQRQGANIATATGRSDRRKNSSGAEYRKSVGAGNGGRINRNPASDRAGQDRGKRKKKKSVFQKLGILLLLVFFGLLLWRFISPYFGPKYWTVAVFGLDSRDGNKEAGALSDVIMLASVNKRTGEVKLSSVFRDSYMQIDEEGTYHKINEAYFKGGHKQAVEALERNLDIKIDDYVSFNWAAVAKGISALGGVDLELSDAEFFYINAFITETVQSTGIPSVHLEHAGMNHLDGIQAVAYGRLRLMDTDFNRTARQRKVLGLAFDKAKKAGPVKLMQVASMVLPELSTSLDMGDITTLVTQVDRYHIGESRGFPFARTTMKIKKMDVVIPATLASNVTELHSYLYGVENYSPSAKVQEISAHIAKVSGVGSPMEDAEEAGTGGGTVRKKEAGKAKAAENAEKGKKKKKEEQTEATKKQETKTETEEESTVKNKKETKEEKKSTEEETKETKEKKETEETVEVGPGAALGEKSLETEENNTPGT
ncbi:LCP family protein [Oribacterium sinus]|nr:LCP family protein [Oribacterium sinus]